MIFNENNMYFRLDQISLKIYHQNVISGKQEKRANTIFLGNGDAA